MNFSSEPSDGAKHVYERLVREHAQPLFRVATRMVGNSADAEDLLQETFTQAWHSIEKLRSPDAGFAWLLQIMRFRWARLMKERSRRHSSFDDEANSSAVNLTHLSEAESRIADQEVLEIALSKLDERFKLPFLLVVMESMPVQEVAATLGLRKGTVLSRVHRAKKRLADAIRELESASNARKANPTTQLS